MSRSRCAAMLAASVALAAVAGCTSVRARDPEPAGPSRAEVGPSATGVPPEPAASSPAGAAPRRVKPPSAVAGELSRIVTGRKDGHPDSETIVYRNARAGQEYWVHAACASPTPGKTLAFEARNGDPGAPDEPLATAEIPCDGVRTVDSLGELPAAGIVVYLRGNRADVSSAYALVAPTPHLPGR